MTRRRRRQTGAGGGGGVITAYEFGTLTLTGAGGITAPGGATISSSTIDGLELSGGYLVRKATGTVTTGTVTWSNGAVWTITAVTGYSFRSLAELNAIVALGVVTLSGKTAYGRYLGPGNSITWGGNNPLDSLTFTSTFTLTSHSGEGGRCRFKGLHWVAGVEKTARVSGTSKLRLTNLEFFHETDRKYAVYNPSGFNVTGACTDIQIDNCLFEADLLTIGHGPVATCLTLVGIQTSAVVTVRDNVFRNTRRGFVGAHCASLTVKRNEVYNFALDGLYAAASSTVTDTQDWLYNYVHDPLSSRYHARFMDNTTPVYLKKTSELTGAADSKKFFIAFFVRNCRDAANASVLLDYAYTQGTAIELYRDSTGKYVFKAKDTGGSTVINMTSTNSYNNHVSNSGGLFTWVLVSVDTDGISRMHCWDESARTWIEEATATAAGQTLDLTAGAATIGCDAALANTMRWAEVGRIAVWHGIAPDITSATVRGYFLDTYNLDLMTPFATARSALGNPIVDFCGDLITVWRTGNNQGTGGNFTVNGTVDGGHTDMFQGASFNELGNRDNTYGMRCIGNVLIAHRSDNTYETARGIQGQFLDDLDLKENAGLIVAGCIVLTNLNHGLTNYNATNTYVIGNMAILPSDALQSGETEYANSPRIFILKNGVSVVPHDAMGADNVAYDTDLTDVTPNALDLNNLDIRQSSLSTHFSGASFTMAALGTKALALAALTNKAGSGAATAVPQQGALPYNANYFDYSGGEWWDHPRLNNASWTAPADLTDQAVSTLVASAAKQVTVTRNPDAAASANGAMIRVPAGVSVKILASNGTTVVTDWTAAGTGAIVGDGQYFQLRVTSNSSNSATDNYTYYIGTASDTWSVTTVAAGAPSFDIVPTDNAVDSSTQTTYTFSAKQLGTAAAGRKIIVLCYFANGSSVRTFSSGTINGQAASQFIAVDGGAGAKTAFGIIADVAAGTSGDIVITMSGACANMSIDVFAAYGLSSSTPTATATDFVDATGVLNLNVNTLNNSLLVALAAATTNATFTWTGATEYTDRTNNAESYVSSAYQKITTGETPRTVTATGSTTLTDERSFAAVFQ